MDASDATLIMMMQPEGLRRLELQQQQGLQKHQAIKQVVQQQLEILHEFHLLRQEIRQQRQQQQLEQLLKLQQQLDQQPEQQPYQQPEQQELQQQPDLQIKQELQQQPEQQLDLEQQIDLQVKQELQQQPEQQLDLEQQLHLEQQIDLQQQPEQQLDLQLQLDLQQQIDLQQQPEQQLDLQLQLDLQQQIDLQQQPEQQLDLELQLDLQQQPEQQLDQEQLELQLQQELEQLPACQVRQLQLLSYQVVRELIEELTNDDNYLKFDWERSYNGLLNWMKSTEMIPEEDLIGLKFDSELVFQWEGADKCMWHDCNCAQHRRWSEPQKVVEPVKPSSPVANVQAVPVPAPASRSILKPQSASSGGSSAPLLVATQALKRNRQAMENSQPQQYSNTTKRIKSLESDGDSAQSSSPQSSLPQSPQSLQSDDETANNESLFRQNQINLHDYISDGVAKNRSESEASEPIASNGQQRICRHYTRRKEEEINWKQVNDTLRNTLIDHCYHLNRDLQHRLKMEPYSETDEEIDVESVSSESVRQAERFKVVQQKRNQPATTSTTKAGTAVAAITTTANTPTTSKAAVATTQNTVVRRPRGRPPGTTNAAKRKKSGLQGTGPATGIKRSAPQGTTDRVFKRPRTETPRGSRGRAPRNGRCRILSLDNGDKRNMHNDMERQRRIGLKNLFDRLRDSVPIMANKKKAPKVSILMNARNYCYDLEHKQMLFLNTKHQLYKRQEQLESSVALIKQDIETMRSAVATK